MEDLEGLHIKVIKKKFSHIKKFGAVLDIGLESVNDTCL